MKKTILYLFAIIGTVCVISKITSFILYENLTSEYWENGKKVKVGMTLEEARKVIGDLKYQYWTQDNKSGEIIISEKPDGTKQYVLEYGMVFAGSDTMKIYFDPNTLIVTKVFYGE